MIFDPGHPIFFSERERRPLGVVLYQWEGIMEKEAVNYSLEEAPVYGELIYEHQFPSEVALVPAVIVRLVGLLDERGWLDQLHEPKLNLCLDEALKNAVIHGNREEPAKVVETKMYQADQEVWIVISDDGGGFDPTSVPDPCNDIGVLNESGRGVYLLKHYTSTLAFWNGGRTVALCFSLSGSKEGESK